MTQLDIFSFNQPAPIFIDRVQRAVGQGGFHTASLTAPSDMVIVRDDGAMSVRRPDQPTLAWIYDCGSERAVELETEILDWQGGGRPMIDFLFVSHFDDDHINGIPRLLRDGDGAFVDTVVMPHVNAIDRLFAFARLQASGFETGAESAAFFRDLIVDPSAAMTRFGPRRILFFRSGPGRDDGPDFNLDGGSGEDRPRWKLVGQDGERPKGYQLPPGPHGMQRAVVRDTASIRVEANLSGYGWMFKPYVRPIDPKARAAFEAEAIKALGWVGKTFVAEIQKPGVLAGLVNDPDKAVKMGGAYEAAVGKGNKNRTSMCIYAGPHAPTDDFSPTGGAGFALALGLDLESFLDPRTIGWLGTGDAELKWGKWARRFVAHYKTEIGRTLTLMLPHHGSEHNFSDTLLSLDPDFVVASAWPKNKTWLHPHKDVVDCVEKHDIAFRHVTYAKDFQEQFLVFIP